MPNILYYINQHNAIHILSSLGCQIYFDGKYKGIHWHIYSDDRFSGMVYIIEVTINPKILAGITDYLTAANYYDMNIAIINFNDSSKKSHLC